jgi:hypothetical protein
MNWKPYELGPDGEVPVTEGTLYLFALELEPGGWTYFVDSMVWDSETDPTWRDGDHGWDLDVPEFYCELEPPR